MELINKLLCEAIQGEMNAEERYLIFSEKAAQEGFQGVAELFTGLSHAESIHIANHSRSLEKNNYPGPLPTAPERAVAASTFNNLAQALEDEKVEFSAMYPSFSRQIQKKHGNNFLAKIALLSIKWAAESEKNHYSLLTMAHKAVSSGKDIDAGKLYLCTVCGNLHYSEKQPEELCPVCGHDVSFYSKVELLP